VSDRMADVAPVAYGVGGATVYRLPTAQPPSSS